MIRRLTVLYDDACGFCVRCAQWLLLQPKWVAVEVVASSSSQVARRFPGLRKLEKQELVVIDDQGGVYRGPKAWLMSIWALAEWRPWAYRLARPSVLPYAKNAFELIGANRHRINSLLGLKADPELIRVLESSVGPADRPRCTGPECEKDAKALTLRRCPRCQEHVPSVAKCPFCGAWLGAALPPTGAPGMQRG